MHETFGQMLKASRKAKGLSQSTLGERLGKAQATVSAWEQNTNGITLGDFHALAMELGWTADEQAEAARLAARGDRGDAAGAA
jgi:transcriptional regulator with XRE-family HTH domain